MIVGVHHVAISTPDLDRFIATYQQWFGFEPAGEGDWQPGNARIDAMVGLQDSAARYAMLRRGNLHLEVFEYATHDPQTVRPRMCDYGITHLCFYCDDIFADYERLKGLGMAFNCPPGGVGAMWATYGRDHDGNVIELLQIVDQESPFAFANLRVPMAKPAS